MSLSPRPYWQAAAIVVVLLIVAAAPSHGQRPPVHDVPVLRPTITVLGKTPVAERGLPPFDNVAMSPNGRLIAYTAGNDFRIWNTLTHEDALVLTGPVHVLTWGRSGAKIVFQTHPGPLQYQGVELSREPGIWTLRLDPTSGKPDEPPHLVVSVPVNHGLYLSPDEQMIAFTMFTGSYVSSLAVVPAAGGAPRILASAVEVSGGQWSSDGSAIYYTAYPDESSATRTRFRVPLVGGAPVAIEEEREDAATADSRWVVADRASGKRVAYMAFPSDVALSDWAGLTAWPGRHEIAAAREVHPRGLRIVNLADGTSRDIVDATAEVGVPTWFPQGERIAVIARQDGRTALLLAAADGSGARRLPLSTPPAFGGPLSDRAQLRISPDGRYAAFKSTEQQTIELMELASGHQRTLIAVTGNGRAPEGRGIGALAWRKDSRSILYISGIWAAEPAVHEVTLSGTDKLVRPLPTFVYGQPPVFFPAPSEPELVEFAGAGTLDQGAVTLLPIRAGSPRVVFPERAMGGPLSPDARTLAIQFRRSSRPGIQVLLAAADGSSTGRLPLPFIALPGVQWHPDGKRLLMLGRETADAPVSLYSVPIDGTAPSVVASTGSSAQEGAAAVSPNGRFAAVTVAGTPTATFLKLDYDVSAALPRATTK